MAESLIVESELTLDEQYKLLIKQLKNLLLPEDNIISNMANLTAALKQTFPKISWVGFYLFNGFKLYLGPFQGKVACANIEIGKGVCGTSAQKRETVIVGDVNVFPNHIACDAASKSEVVIPILKNFRLYGVLDIDSPSYNAFDNTDKKYLEEICGYLSEKFL